MVIGSADQVRKIIKRDCTAKFSEPLANAVAHLDVSQTIAMAVAMPKVLPAALAKTPFNLEILKEFRPLQFTARLHRICGSPPR